MANHSKLSVAVEGDEVAARLDRILGRSRVLIENVGRSRLARANAEPSAVARRHANLVVSVSGLGTEGPLAGYRVYANNVHAYGGLSELTRDARGEPARLGTVLADPLSAMTAATAIAAWAMSEHRNSGATLDLSMSEVVANAIGEYVVAASLGQDRNGGGSTTPTGIYACDGGWLALEIESEQDLETLLETLDSSAGDDVGALAEELATRPLREILDLFIDAGLAAWPVVTAADLLNDEHLARRDFFAAVDHPDPDIGQARLVGLPWRFVGGGALQLGAPPALGNANADPRWQMEDTA